MDRFASLAMTAEGTQHLEIDPLAVQGADMGHRSLYQDWFELGCRNSNFLEAIIAAIAAKCLKQGNHAIDGGANAGLHTWPMADHVGRSGTILAVEPIPVLAKKLIDTARKRDKPQVMVIDAALGTEAGRSNFTWVKAAPTRSGLKKRSDLTANWEKSTQDIDMSVCTIDALASQFSLAPRVIKLDLEGGEYHALKGAALTLKRDRPIVIFENGRQFSADLYGYTSDEWYDFFSQVNYSIYTIFGEPFDASSWRDAAKPWYAIGIPVGCSICDYIDSDLQVVILEVERSFRQPVLYKLQRWLDKLRAIKLDR
jgi:FkbM family methyltransferase